MRPRWQKVINDLWSNRTRSLLVILSIATGLFSLGTITTMRAIIHHDMRVGYAAAIPANIQLVTSYFDHRMVDRMKKIPGVRQAEGARNFSLRLKLASGDWQSINIRSVADWENSNVNKLRLIEGSWPPGDHQIALEQYKLADTEAQLGEIVRIELPGGQLHSFMVSAIVSEQTLGSYDTGPGFFLAPPQAYVSRDMLGYLDQNFPAMFNTLNITVENNSEDKAYLLDFADHLSKELEKGGVETYSLAARGTYDHPNRVFVDAISILLVLLGFMVVFLSTFLITSTLQALISQQITQIGIMKTVGARRRQIEGIYLVMIFCFSLVSIIIALPASNEISFLISSRLAHQINFTFQGNRPVLSSAILQIAIGIIIPQLAAYFPIWQGVKLSIQEALSGIQQNQLVYQDILSRRLTRWSALSRPNLVALRNTFRRKGRLILTLITLALGGSIFIATFNIRNSMAEYVRQVSKYFVGDINLYLRRSYRIEEINQVLSHLPEIEAVEAWGSAASEMYQAEQVGESVQFLAPPSGSKLVTPVMITGRWIEPGDENAVALNETFLARYPSIHVGDKLPLRINGKKTEWTIVGFFRLAGRNTSLIAYANYEYLAKLTGSPGLASVFRIVARQKGMSEADQRALGNQIEAILVTSDVNVAEVTAGNWLSSSAAKGFSILTSFLLFLSMLTALVGCIGLAGTMSMNVFERTREIGILRAIGASNPILMRMILTEGLLIGLISWTLALFLSWPISRIIYDNLSKVIFGVKSEMSISPIGYLIWLGFVVLLSLAASYLPARSAANLTIREVLAYE